jgi:branched-chain amino acid transport system permease protein
MTSHVDVRVKKETRPVNMVIFEEQTMDILIGSLVAGILIGMILALVALGLTIIFGVMDIVNFAHGEFLMIGMYTGLLTAQATGIDPLLTLPVAAMVGFLLGVICYYGFIKYLVRGPMVAQLLGTFGLMLFLRNFALLIFGSEDRSVHSGLLVGKSFAMGMGVIIPATKLAAAVLSVVAFLAIWLLINRTKTGKALTATALNAQGARYMGIPTDRMNAFAWGIGGASVTIAGALLVNFWSVNPFVGILFTMIAFAIVALGGFGSVPGAFFAGLVVGMIMEIPGIWDFLTYTLNSDWMTNVPMTSLKYTFVYLAYFIIMVLRPRGLFGWKH